MADMGRLGFLIAMAVCAICLVASGALWAMAHGKKTDWTSPQPARLEVRSRICLAIAVFAGICCFALYEWTYLGH